MKKWITLLLLASMLLATVSCGGAAETDAPENTPAAETETETETETEPPLSDDLPDTDCGGRSYRIASFEGYEDEFYTEELTGEVENDAVFNRNARLEERFNISIEALAMTDGAGGNYRTLVKYVTAGDDYCDVAAQEVWNLHIATAAGIYHNWNDTKYINPEKPWWNQLINENATFNGKLFALTGSYTVTYMTSTMATYVNSNLLKEYGMEQDALYSLVQEGGWTLDYMGTLAESMYKDTNGDGTRDKTDRYGYAANWYYSDAWCSAFDIPVTGKAADGSLEIKLMQEKTYDALTRVYQLYFENEGVYFKESWDGLMEEFMGDMAVFVPGELRNAFNELRDMDDPFGVLPNPKYDESQETYHCLVADGYFVTGMPTTVTDTDFVSLITEAMAADTYINVYPVYYDVALKSKYSQDEATAAMVDLIAGGAAFDVSFMYGTYMEMLPYMFRGCLNEKTTDLVSKYAASEKKIEAALEKIYAMYE
ncbi:MAG: hypothetical protein E7631_03640 [Ruminococcaceae bacterium]|nr:hypothetical protein [Oscillospiraceae bacterium]